MADMRDRLIELLSGCSLDTDEDARYVANKLIAADVAPVVHGRWIPEYEIKEMYYSPDDIERYKVPNGFSCSVCTKWNSARTNYCPNCGAHMKDGE